MYLMENINACLRVEESEKEKNKNKKTDTAQGAVFNILQ